MVETQSMQSEICSLRFDGLGSISVGLGDFTSEFLDIDRDSMFNLFEHPEYSGLIAAVDTIIDAAEYQKAQVFVGGLPTSWLHKIQARLSVQPVGWWLRADPIQVAWYTGVVDHEE